MFQLDRTVTDLLLTASIHHLRSTMEELPIGMIQIDRHSQIRSIDRASEALLGYPPGSLAGKSAQELFDSAAAEMLESIRRRVAGYSGKLKMLRKDETSFEVNVVVAPGMEPHLLTMQIIYASC